MYMREMGTVELLTREGEIVIAKRIEEGIRELMAALAYYPRVRAQTFVKSTTSSPKKSASYQTF